MNPYEVLGVRKNASAESIRKAHRKLAVEHHPDRGGDPERFRHVQEAYEVLKDAARRAHFDATGQTARVVDQSRPMALAAIHRHLVASIQAIMQRGQNPSEQDILKIVKSRFTEEKAAQATNRAGLQKAADGLTSLRGRFQSTDENILATMVEGEIASCQVQLEALTGAERVTAMAMEILATHSFTADKPQESPWDRELRKFQYGALGTTSKAFFGGFSP